MVQFGAIRSRQKVVQLLAEILKQKSQWRFRRVRRFSSFSTAYTGFFEFRDKAVFRENSGFQAMNAQRRSIRFPYSELTAIRHVLVPARLIDGWSFEPDLRI